MGTTRRVYVFSLSAVALWCGFIVLTPVSRLLGFPTDLTAAFYKVFSHVCHQLPDRSLFLGAEPLGVCARCTAVYFGFLASMVVLPSAKPAGSGTPARWVLVAALAPMALDVALSVTGIHASTIFTRLLTGLVAGATLPFFVLPPFFEAIQQFKAHRGDPVHAKQTR